MSSTLTRATLPIRCALALIVACLVPTLLQAAPQPDPVPRRWELTVEPGPLRTATLRIPGEGERSFYYFTYSVTNNTGADQTLAPIFELYTDDGEIRRSNRNVPRDAVRQLLQKLRNPLLEDEITIQGTIFPGRENAKDGLVVWPVGDLGIDEVTIFAQGFSGETRKYTRPDTGEEVILRKTLTLRHKVPGELNPNSSRPIERTEERWILR